MPEIASFRGILYDQSKVDLAKVVAPPADAIEPAARAQLAAADPHNVVRLIQPEPDGPLDRHASAARALDGWLGAGVLVRDPYKAVYRYLQHFRSPDDGRPRCRRGFIAAVRLASGTDCRMQTHQRLFASVRAEQTALARATSAHLTPLTALYADASGEVERVLRPTESKPATVDLVTGDGVRHLLWRVNDAELVGKVRRAMAPKKLVIADGHHRLDAMIALRDRLAEQAGGLSQYSSAHYGMMFLCSLTDDGLVVLPHHRLLHGVAGFDRKTLLARAREYFMVEAVPGGARDPGAVRRALEDAPGHQPAIVVAFPGEADGWRLTLDPHIDPTSLGVTGHAAVVRTDVTLLHGIVFDRILGLSSAAQEPAGNLRYAGDLAAAQAALATHQAAFFLAPLKLDGLRHIAEVGDALPPRSTLFYPRLASGLVIQRVDPDEDLM